MERTRDRWRERAVGPRRDEVEPVRLRNLADVLAVEVVQLLKVEEGRVGDDTLQGEVLEELFARDDRGLVVQRPAEEHEEVQHRGRQIAVAGVVEQGRVAAPLAQLLAVWADDKGEVGEGGRLEAKRFVDLEVLGRARDPLFTADGVRNAHPRVIDDEREVVGRKAIGLERDEVVLERVLENDIAADDVMKDGLARGFHAEADGARLRAGSGGGLGGGDGAAAAVVARRLFGGGLSDAHRVEPFGGTEAAVGGALRHQVAGGGLVHLETLRLNVRAVRASNVRAFVPIDTQPAKALVDSVHRGGDEAGLVGVFEAEEELPVVGAGHGPGEDGRADVPNVRVTGGGGCIAGADFRKIHDWRFHDSRLRPRGRCLEASRFGRVGHALVGSAGMIVAGRGAPYFEIRLSNPIVASAWAMSAGSGAVTVRVPPSGCGTPSCQAWRS